MSFSGGRNRVMELMVLCLVFLPLLLLFIAIFFKGEKIHAFTVISGFLFILCTLVLFINPGFLHINLPALLWKLLSLLTVFFIFFRSIKDKQYIISIFTLIQAFLLIIFEITHSPTEPEPYLYFNCGEKLLLMCGAFIAILFIPFIIYCSKKYYENSTDKQIKRFIAGFIFLLSSFAGLMAAKSMSGLFLFWQWVYLSGYYLFNTYGQGERKRIFPFIQQAILTLFMALNIITYRITGSLAMQDFSLGIGKISEIAAVIIYMSVILMGLLIPESYIFQFKSSKAASETGFYLIIVSLIVPYGVLLKFRPLFQNLHHGLISLMIIYGSLLVFTGAYFALLYRQNRQSLFSMIMCISGLGVATVFKDIQIGIDFLSGNPLPLLLVIFGIILIAAFILSRISYLFTTTNPTPETVGDRRTTAFIPFNLNFDLLIRMGWITTATLFLGVSLSCLK